MVDKLHLVMLEALDVEGLSELIRHFHTAWRLRTVPKADWAAGSPLLGLA